MAETSNLRPGSKVPQTGTYTCIYCGPDGMGAAVLKRAIQAMGLPFTPTGSALKTPPRRTFQAGETFPSCPNCQGDKSGADPTGWSLVTGPATPEKKSPATSGWSGPTMEVPGSERASGLCSDDACPCGYPGATIAKGQGYIYISKEVAEFRLDCPSVAATQAKIQRMQTALGGAMIMAGAGVFAPILMCEQGARKRGLNLEVAAADARYWWETGQVPIRATPLAGESAANAHATSTTAAGSGEGEGCLSLLLLTVTLAGSAAAAGLILALRLF